MPVIVQAVVTHDAEIVLRAGVARLRGSQQLFLYPAGPLPWRSRGHGRTHLRPLQLEFHLAEQFRGRGSVVLAIGVAASAGPGTARDRSLAGCEMRHSVLHTIHFSH